MYLCCATNKKYIAENCLRIYTSHFWSMIKTLCMDILFLMPLICQTLVCRAEVFMNGPISEEAVCLNCNGQLTGRDQKHINSTAGHFPVSSPSLLYFSVRQVVPKKPGRLQHFSFQSVICFLFRLKCDWFGVTQKSGGKNVRGSIVFLRVLWLLSRVEMHKSGGQ